MIKKSLSTNLSSAGLTKLEEDKNMPSPHFQRLMATNLNAGLWV
jgi:hypothetical protein